MSKLFAALLLLAPTAALADCETYTFYGAPVSPNPPSRSVFVCDAEIDVPAEADGGDAVVVLATGASYFWNGASWSRPSAAGSSAALRLPMTAGLDSVSPSAPRHSARSCRRRRRAPWPR